MMRMTILVCSSIIITCGNRTETEKCQDQETCIQNGKIMRVKFWITLLRNAYISMNFYAMISKYLKPGLDKIVNRLGFKVYP